MAGMVGYEWPSGHTKQVAYANLGAGQVALRGHIQELFVGVGGGWQAGDLTAFTNSPVAIVPASLAGYAWQAAGTKQIVYVDGTFHIQELSVGSHRVQRWQVADLTAITNAPLANGGPIAAYEWQAGGTKQVVYVDQNGHIQELSVGVGGGWQEADLTAITNAPAAASDAGIAAYQWQAGISKQVVYVDQNGHIQELSVTGGGGWQAADLTAITNAPLVYLGLGEVIAAYQWQAGISKQVVYVDRNNHIQELSEELGSGWQVADLTAITNAPLAAIPGISGYEWQVGGTKQVVYVDFNSHIQELYVGLGSPWRVADLTAIANAPVVEATVYASLRGYEWQAGGTKQVVYPGPNWSLQELYVGVGGRWQAANLSAITGYDLGA